MTITILDRLEPTDIHLLARLFDRVDDAMLLEIARMDYGDDVDLHLAALHQIRAGDIPVPMLWHPGEVIALTRWTEISTTTIENGAKRSHWLRIFACTVLLWASLEPAGYDGGIDDSYWWQLMDGEDSTIIQFVDSALSLGEEISLAALRFLGWRMQSQLYWASLDGDFGECHLYAVAMLLLWAFLFDRAAVPADLDDRELVSFLISTARCHEEYRPLKQDIDDCQLADRWREKIQNLLLAPNVPDGGRSNLELQNFGRELITEIPQNG